MLPSQAHGHRGHDTIMYVSAAGGCCDCGDAPSWKPEGACQRHSSLVSDLPRHIGLGGPVHESASSAGRRRLVPELVATQLRATIRSVPYDTPV